jgi:transposase-like protein DUF772
MARTGWGYERLVGEVSDSLHLRRFCLIGLADRVPDESTLRKLCRRLGPDTVDALTREAVARSAAQTGFRARAARIDSTVVEADIKSRPTPAWRPTASRCWRARAASWRAWRAPARRACATAPVARRAACGGIGRTPRAPQRRGQGRGPSDHPRVRRAAGNVRP